MLHACAERFDVIGNLENFLVFGWTKQGLKNQELFKDFSLHQILQHIHLALNIDKNKN